MPPGGESALDLNLSVRESARVADAGMGWREASALLDTGESFPLALLHNPYFPSLVVTGDPTAPLGSNMGLDIGGIFDGTSSWARQPLQTSSLWVFEARCGWVS